MHKKSCIILVFIAILFYSFTVTDTINPKLEKEYKLYGESEHWIGEYVCTIYRLSKENNCSHEIRHEFNISYKNSLEEFSSVKYLKYIYKNNKGKKTGAEEIMFDSPPSEKVFSHGSSECRDTEYMETFTPDEVIEVQITWNGNKENKESLILKPRS